MSTLKERLKLARNKADKSQSEVAEHVGLRQASYSDLETGKSKSSAKIYDIATYLNVNPEWLIKGEGQIKSPSIIRDEIAQAPTAQIKTGHNPNKVKIPFYDLRFSCGAGEHSSIELVELDKHLDFEPDFFKRRNLNPEFCKMFRASGHSMKNYIMDNDAVMVYTKETELMEDEVYALYFEGDRFFRRIEKHAGGVVHLVADNPLYKPKIISEDTADALFVVGRVVYRSG